MVRLLHFTSDKNVQNLLREPYKFTEEVKQLQQQAVESTEIDRNIWHNGHLRGFQPTKCPLRPKLEKGAYSLQEAKNNLNKATDKADAVTKAIDSFIAKVRDKIQG